MPKPLRTPARMAAGPRTPQAAQEQQGRAHAAYWRTLVASTLLRARGRPPLKQFLDPSIPFARAAWLLGELLRTVESPSHGRPGAGEVGE